MTDSKRKLRCDRRYLGICLATQLAILAAVIVANRVLGYRGIVEAVSVSLVVVVIVRWLIQLTWKFTSGPDQLRTEKLFTNHIDLRTPLDQVVGIQAYEGVIEAILGVGTIEISTASSLREHVSVQWPHLRNARAEANRLESLLKEKRPTR